MSDTPSPLEPDQLDELLSAALDGELDAAAGDLGITAATAVARIRATPGADERRAALVSARDLLAQTPAIDELLAARLRAKAVRAAVADHAARTDERKTRRNRLALGVTGIAAALAAVVAVAAGVDGFNPDSSSSRSSASADAPLTDSSVTDSSGNRELAPGDLATPTAPALGSFTDLRSLTLAAVQKDAVTRSLAGGDTPSKSSIEPAPVSAGAQTENQNSKAEAARRSAAPTTYAKNNGLATDSSGDSADKSARFGPSAGSPPACDVPDAVPEPDTSVLRATATLAGKPVVVFVFGRDNEQVVVVTDTDCKLVNLQTFR